MTIDLYKEKYKSHLEAASGRLDILSLHGNLHHNSAE